MQKPATRSPSATLAPSGALRTVPPTSLPGTNGSSGLNWYWPRVCSSSGNETPALSTSMTTPEPGVSGCEGSGSGRSAISSALSGPSRLTIWMAFTRGTLSLRRAADLVELVERAAVVPREGRRRHGAARVGDDLIAGVRRARAGRVPDPRGHVVAALRLGRRRDRCAERAAQQRPALRRRAAAAVGARVLP